MKPAAIVLSWLQALRIHLVLSFYGGHDDVNFSTKIIIWQIQELLSDETGISTIIYFVNLGNMVLPSYLIKLFLLDYLLVYLN